MENEQLLEDIKNRWWKGESDEMDYHKHQAILDLIDIVESLQIKQDKSEKYLKNRYPKIYKEVYGDDKEG